MKKAPRSLLSLDAPEHVFTCEVRYSLTFGGQGANGTIRIRRPLTVPELIAEAFNRASLSIGQRVVDR